MARLTYSFAALDEAAVRAVAAACGRTPTAYRSITVWAHGDIGAGKTAFFRVLLRTFGADGHIKSPTYAIIESYVLPVCTVYHCDLYRITAPIQLEDIGLRNCIGDNNCLLIEWPLLGESNTPSADITITLTQTNAHADKRDVCIEAKSIQGNECLRRQALDVACARYNGIRTRL